MSCEFISTIATYSSDHSIPVPSFNGDDLHLGYVSESLELVVPAGYTKVPVDARSKVSALYHSSGVYFFVDSPATNGRVFYLLAPSSRPKVVYTTTLKDRNILRVCYLDGGSPAVIFSVVGEFGDTQLFKYVLGGSVDIILAPLVLQPSGQVNTEFSTHFPGVISDLKLLDGVGKVFLTVRAPGLASSTIYVIPLEDSRQASIYHTSSFGIIESIAPCLVNGQVYCFCMTLARRSDGVASYISKELFLLEGSSRLIEVAVEGFESARNLHSFFDGQHLNLCYLSGEDEAHPSSLYWCRTSDISSTSPQWQVSYLQPQGRPVLGFCFDGSRGVVSLQGSTSELYLLELPSSSSNPSIVMVNSDSLSRLVESPASVHIDNPEGLNLFTSWSCSASSICILNPTRPEVTVIYGLEAPSSIDISVTIQRGFLAPRTLTLRLTAKPHQEPHFFNVVEPLHFDWHELKDLVIDVVHDPLYPPNLLVNGRLVSVGLSYPKLQDKSVSPAGVSLSEVMTRFTFQAQAWHTGVWGVTSLSPAITLTLSDSLGSYTATSLLATFEPFPTNILGVKYLSRSRYRGSIKGGNLGLGYQPLEVTSLLSDFQKAFKASTSLGEALVFSGSHAVLFVYDWGSTPKHRYHISYNPLVDSCYSEGRDTCFLLTSTNLDAYVLGSTPYIIHTQANTGGSTQLPSNFSYWDSPSSTLSVKGLLASTPLELISTSCGCIIRGGTDLSIIDSETSLRVDVSSLGFPGFTISKVREQDITSTLSGKILLLLSKGVEKLCVLYDLSSRSVLQVFSAEDLQSATLLKSSV